jgi:hypothetical protein
MQTFQVHLLTFVTGVELYGSEFDDVSRRGKHYTSVNDMYKRTWSQTSVDIVGVTNLTSQLLHLLMKLFSEKCILAPPPSTSSDTALQRFCQEMFSKEEGRTGKGDEMEGRESTLGDGVKEEEVEVERGETESREKESVEEGDEGEKNGGERGDTVTNRMEFLNLAHPQAQTLSLVYADSELLFEFLQILSLLSSSVSRSRQAEIKLYEEFVLFLYNNCQERSCFFEPIRRVLGMSPVRNSRLSKLFVSLITNTPSRAFQGRSNSHETAEFIRCGGGMIVLNSLIAASKQAQFVTDNTGSFSVHSVHKLGQKDTPLKPVNDSTELIDFVPHSFLYRSSIKGAGKVTPNNNLRSYSLFQHTYSSDEKWVQLHVIFPHPVLLYNVIACVIAVDSTSVSHGGPSKMLVECSAHGGPNSCVPVTPVFITDSLKIVNIAFRQPVLTQHMVVHFHRPLLSNTVVISKMEVLGTSFGANAQSIAPSLTSSASLPAQQNQEHQA